MTRLQADFKDFLRSLNANRVEYLLIGGYAVGYHGYPRATTVKSDYPYAPHATPPAFPETKFAAASTEQNVIGLFPTPGQR